MGVRTIYIDMVFLVNFMMDLLLLSLLQSVLLKKSRWYRLCLGAAAGAVWACGAVVIIMPGWLELAGSMTAAMAMTAVGFGEKEIRTVFCMSFALLCLSCFLSGLVRLIYEHTGAGYFMQAGGVPSFLLFPVIGAGAVMVRKGAQVFWRYQGIQRQLCRVTITHQGKTIALSGLVDTGNRLYEPYGGRPVHIVETDCVRSMLPPEQRFLSVPYHSVGTAGGMLQCFVAQEMLIDLSGKVFRQEKPVVALSPNGLNGRRRYQMIVHPDILQSAMPANRVAGH